MMLRCAKFESELELQPNMPVVLNIEHTQLFVECVRELCALQANASNIFEILERGAVKKIKCNTIVDYINFEINSRSIVSALSKSVVSKLNINPLQINTWLTEGYSIINDVCLNYDADITIDPIFNVANIFKLYSIGISEQDNCSILEKLITYINALIEFYSLDVLILVSPKDYLNSKEYAQLLQHCAYKEVCLLIIQSHQSYAFPCEQVLIIDDDLCEIVDKSATL